MKQAALYLLGPVRLEYAGAPAEVDTRKALALFAYLALEPRPHTRDSLAALLWPEHDQSHARGTLRRTLSVLNHAIGGELLAATRETLDIRQRDRLWVDVDAFSAHLAACAGHDHPEDAVCPRCVEPLRQAVALYRDDFMVGFALRASAGFEDWQFYRAQQLRRAFASALRRLTRCHVAAGDFAAAHATASRWLALDRLHEPAHRWLMRIYAWSGERGAALRQYRQCVQILEQELGVAPLAPTSQLYEAIKQNQAPPPPPRWQADGASDRGTGTMPTRDPEGPAQGAGSGRPADAPAMPAHGAGDDRGGAALAGGGAKAPAHGAGGPRYPLLGREAELAALRGAYRAAADSGRVVALVGEAGIGKSRLAEELLAEVRQAGGRVVAARCFDGESGLAYGPLVAALRAALAGDTVPAWVTTLAAPWVTEIARVVPELTTVRELAGAAPALDSPGARSRFFEGLRQGLLAAARGARPGVILMDDLQWADAATLDVLTYSARRLADSPALLVLAYRPGQAPQATRLRQLMSDAQRAGSGTTIELPRLAEAAVRALVGHGPAAVAAAPNLAARLVRETEGLPYFVIAYLSALEQGLLDPTAATWQLPGGARELLDSLLRALDETEWQVLSAAAVIGRSFDFDTLLAVSGRSDDEAVTALEGLLTHHLIVEARAGAATAPLYDFSHDKLRELALEETSLARRRLLHRRAAESLAAHAHGDGASASQIAAHFLAAGNEPAAAEYERAAGAHARGLYAHREALAHFNTALALGHGDAAWLHEQIGDLRTLLGEYRAALASYEAAAALAGATAPAAIEHKLGDVHARRGAWELADSHLRTALEGYDAATHPAEHARILADRSLVARNQGESNAAEALAARALAVATTAGDPRGLAQAHNMLGMLAGHAGDPTRARRHLEESLALADQLSDPDAAVAALNNLALTCAASGDVPRALELTREALRRCTAIGDRHRAAALHSNLADLLHADQPQEAMAHLEQSVAIFAEIGVEAGAWQPEIWKLTEW
jgi:DNA-binding SARP family transcriptional activator/tetratricopeptide (TPR) repeat protein